MRKAIRIFLGSVIATSGCTRTSVMPLAADTVAITTSAAPVCGETGAQSATARQAAVQTIRSGYDRFMILGHDASSTVRVVGYTPVTANTNYTGTVMGSPQFATVNGSAMTTYSGGTPIIGGHHTDAVIVKMFHDGDPAGTNAVAARAILGPDWQSAINSSSRGMCF